MGKNKLAIIGGSGLYDIEEFKKRKEIIRVIEIPYDLVQPA